MVGDSKDLQLRNVAVSHTAPFKSIQAGSVGLPGTTECGRGRKSLIWIAPALEEHPGAPSASTMPGYKAWRQQNIVPLLEDAHEADVPELTGMASYCTFGRLLEMSYHFCGVNWVTEGVQKAMKNESFSETTFLLGGRECLDGGSLAACKKIEGCKVCGKACHF